MVAAPRPVMIFQNFLMFGYKKEVSCIVPVTGRTLDNVLLHETRRKRAYALMPLPYTEVAAILFANFLSFICFFFLSCSKFLINTIPYNLFWAPLREIFLLGARLL